MSAVLRVVPNKSKQIRRDFAEEMLQCQMAFLIFEFCVGVYFPSIGTVKSELVPERIRATMYNMCRVPLNAVVVGLLLTNLTVIQCFRLCAILLAIVFLAAVGVKRSFSEAVPEVFAKMK